MSIFDFIATAGALVSTWPILQNIYKPAQLPEDAVAVAHEAPQLCTRYLGTFDADLLGSGMSIIMKYQTAASFVLGPLLCMVFYFKSNSAPSEQLKALYTKALWLHGTAGALFSTIFILKTFLPNPYVTTSPLEPAFLQLFLNANYALYRLFTLSTRAQPTLLPATSRKTLAIIACASLVLPELVTRLFVSKPELAGQVLSACCETWGQFSYALRNLRFTPALCDCFVGNSANVLRLLMNALWLTKIFDDVFPEFAGKRWLLLGVDILLWVLNKRELDTVTTVAGGLPQRGEEAQGVFLYARVLVYLGYSCIGYAALECLFAGSLWAPVDPWARFRTAEINSLKRELAKGFIAGYTVRDENGEVIAQGGVQSPPSGNIESTPQGPQDHRLDIDFPPAEIDERHAQAGPQTPPTPSDVNDEWFAKDMKDESLGFTDEEIEELNAMGAKGLLEAFGDMGESIGDILGGHGGRRCGYGRG